MERFSGELVFKKMPCKLCSFQFSAIFSNTAADSIKYLLNCKISFNLLTFNCINTEAYLALLVNLPVFVGQIKTESSNSLLNYNWQHSTAQILFPQTLTVSSKPIFD
jgi:hypothetical protein